MYLKYLLFVYSYSLSVPKEAEKRANHILYDSMESISSVQQMMDGDMPRRD